MFTENLPHYTWSKLQYRNSWKFHLNMVFAWLGGYDVCTYRWQ